MENGHSYLLTGQCGTGKTYMMRLLNVSIWKNEKNTEKKTNQRGGNLRVNRTHFFMQMDESGIQQAWLPMEMSFMSSPFLRYWEGHDDKESSVSR